jgi:hypothetical protein
MVAAKEMSRPRPSILAAAVVMAAYSSFLIVASQDRFAILFCLFGFVGAVLLLRNTEIGKQCAVAFAYLPVLYSIVSGSVAATLLHAGLAAAILVCLFADWMGASLRPLRARTPVPAWSPRAVGEGASQRLESNNINVEQAKELKMPADTNDIDKLKYNLEVEKFRWQQSMDRKQNNVLIKHFGVIITAIVSFATIVVSYLQLTISSNNAKNQIDNDRIKNDRQFYFEIAKFLLDNQQEMATREVDKVKYLRKVVITAFPTDAAIQIATGALETESDQEIKKIWAEALTQLRARR